LLYWLSAFYLITLLSSKRVDKFYRVISGATRRFFTEVAFTYKKYKGNDQYQFKPEFNNPQKEHYTNNTANHNG
jgi:hypothetical protein